MASAKITCDSCQTKCIYVFVVAVVLSLLGIDPKGESKSFSHSKSDAGEKKKLQEDLGFRTHDPRRAAIL